MRNLLIISIILLSCLWAQSDTTVVVSGESGIFTTDASDPFVDWFNPDMGDSFQVNEQFTGSWDATDEELSATPVTIYYSIGIGTIFTIVEEDLLNNFTTTLTAPATATEFLRIAIRVRDQFGNAGWDYTQGYINVGDGGTGDTTTTVTGLSVGFTIDTQEPSVTLTAPDVAAAFGVGESVPCTWTASDNSFGATPIAIGITTKIGDSISVLLSDIDNSSSAAFILPAVETWYGRVFVIAKDEYGNVSYDGSDQYLTFGNPGSAIDSTTVVSNISANITVDASDPIVNLFTPNGGDTYLEETNFNVAWDATDELLDTDPISIYMSTTIGGIFENQADFLLNDGLEVITAPLGPVDFGQIRVAARDHYGNVGQDQSDGYFTVFESGTGAIQGYLHTNRTFSGTLYLSLWFPGRDPEIHSPDREQPSFLVNINAGDSLLYSFANLLPGTGYSIRAFIDQTGSDNSSTDSCDYGHDLSGYSTLITVTSDLVTENTDIDLIDCEDFYNGDFSLKFDGIDDYLEIPDAPELNPDTALTICAWVKPQLWNNTGHIVSKGSGSNQYSLRADTNQFVFEINGAGPISMSLPPLGAWTFISAVFKNNSLDLYGNGILQSSTDISSPLDPNPDPLFIGRKSSGSPEADAFNGLIDYVSIWNRGLTNAEIISVMENGVDPLTANNLSGYWNFVEGIANTIHDEGNFANHGQLHGVDWDTSVHFIEPDLPPGLPQNFNASSSDQSAYLTWSINREYDISYYSIFRDTSVANPQFIDQVPHPDNGYINVGLENGKSYYYWITAVDITGNSSDTAGFNIVIPNGPPAWTGLTDTSFYEDDSLGILLDPLIFDDSDHDSTLVIQVSPGSDIFSSYNADNYQVKFVSLPDSSGYTEQFIISASDPMGLVARDSFFVSVIPVNDPPVIISPAVQSPTEGYRFVYQAIGTDIENSTLIWTFTDLPSWLDSDADSLFGIPPESAPDTLFHIHLSDGELTDSMDVILNINHVDNLPVITSPLQVNAVEDEYFYYQAIGSDPEGATLAWTFDMAANWLTANSDSIFGYPREGDADTSFRIIASDGNLSDTAYVILLVEAVNDPPSITSANAITAIEDDLMVYHATAQDPDNTVLNYSFIDLPTWLTANSDSVFGIPDYYNNDTSFMIIADDGILADTLDVSVTIQLVNDYPVLILDIDAAEKHGDFTFNLQATDEETPSVAVSFEYSIDNINWVIPAILSSGNDFYSWASAADFPDDFQPQVWLKAIGSDGSNATTVVSPSFSIDNHIGSLEIDLNTSTEFNEQVTVPYLISDATNDIYSLTAAFIIDDGLGWRAATVSGLQTQIDPSNYSGSLNWDSDADLPDLYIDAQFALLPSDDWQTGAGDTVQLLIDNQNLVTLTNFSAADFDAVNWFTEFQLGFDLPVDTTSFNSGIRLIGDNQGNIPLDFNYDSQNQVISISPQEWFHANDTIRLEINDNLLDQTGDPFDGNSNDIADGSADRVEYPLYVNILGDYDQSGEVEFDDLVVFRDNWLTDSSQISEELGPASGLPPNLHIQPDSSFDFEDMMVFVQMWNWSAGFENYNFLARSILNDDIMSVDVFYPGRTQSTDEDLIVLSVKLDSAVAMGAMEVVLSYDPSIISFKEINYGIDREWLKLFYTDNSGKLTINLADLGGTRNQMVLNLLSIKFSKIISTETSVIINSDIRNQSGIPVQIMQKEYYFDTDAPVPTKYALHQNYPNPFNPETTIKYELPLDGSVRLTIHNILGQEVIRLVDGWQSAGYKTVSWNGLNSTGTQVSGGMYFLRMETNSFNAVRKLILLK